MKLLNVFWRHRGWPLYLGWETAECAAKEVRGTAGNLIRRIRSMEGPGVYSLRVKISPHPTKP